jgi:hypothetical protein
LEEEREYEISRQDRKIGSSPDRSLVRPRPTGSSIARRIGNTAVPDRRMICAEPRATLAIELLAQRMDVGMMMVFASYGWDDCSDARMGGGDPKANCVV